MTSTALVAPANAAGATLQPTTGCTGCLSAPAQGDGPSNRDGNKIVAKSIFLEGVVIVNDQTAATSPDVSAQVYVALVMDTQSNGASLSSQDVFTNPGGQVVLAASPLRNMSYTQRFRILAVKRISLKMPPILWNNTAGSEEQAGFHEKFTLSWKGMMPVTFTTGSTTADIANVTNNSIQLVAFASNLDLVPAITYNCRMRFVG